MKRTRPASLATRGHRRGLAGREAVFQRVDRSQAFRARNSDGSGCPAEQEGPVQAGADLALPARAAVAPLARPHAGA